MNKILEIKFGSHLYGTSTPESDLDLKGIYLPTADQILLQKSKGTYTKSRNKQECERNTKDDVDLELLSLDRFLDLLLQGQTMALDMLFAPQWAYTYQTREGERIMDYVLDNRDQFLNKNVNAFVGYARQQAAKYGIKGSRMDALKRAMAALEGIPDYERLEAHSDRFYALVKECQDLISLEKTPLVEILDLPQPGNQVIPHLHINGRKIGFKCTAKFARDLIGKALDGYGNRAHKAHLAGGVDWKALSHAVRVNEEALELLKTGAITFPRPERELLLQIKTGQLKQEFVFEKIEQGLADLMAAQDISELPESPNLEFANQMIVNEHAKIVLEEKK